MASAVCLKRLRKDLRDFQKAPPEGMRTKPLEDNILEWHFVIEGATNTAYEGGWYAPDNINIYAHAR
jgi:ubiquitin-conjugating enzyme E2 J2